jgi:hypothetical protein
MYGLHDQDISCQNLTIFEGLLLGEEKKGVEVAVVASVHKK